MRSAKRKTKRNVQDFFVATCTAVKERNKIRRMWLFEKRRPGGRAGFVFVTTAVKESKKIRRMWLYEKRRP